MKKALFSLIITLVFFAGNVAGQSCGHVIVNNTNCDYNGNLHYIHSNGTPQLFPVFIPANTGTNYNVPNCQVIGRVEVFDSTGSVGLVYAANPQDQLLCSTTTVFLDWFSSNHSELNY